MYCSNCGAEVKGNFCSKCGAKVEIENKGTNQENVQSQPIKVSVKSLAFY